MYVLMSWLLCMSVANSTSFVCGNKRKGEREKEEKKNKNKDKKPYLHTHMHTSFFLKTLSFCIRFIVYSLIDIYMGLIDSCQSWSC